MKLNCFYNVSVVHLGSKGEITIKKRAFTLIELLVVIAIIALLMAILMPSLHLAREQARSVHCVHNVRTLTLAWLMYKDDNDDKLVCAMPGGKPNEDYPIGWVQGPSGGNPDPIERKKEGIRLGLLFPYAGKDVDVYRCPSDRRKLVPGQQAFRSYSIVGGVNGENWSGYKQVEQYSEIKSPATKVIFLAEADPRGWNMGSWVMNPTDLSRWDDPFAIWHTKTRTSLGWADGRADMHRWVDKSTHEMCEAAFEASMGGNAYPFGWTVPADEGEDIRFMAKAFPRKEYSD